MATRVILAALFFCVVTPLGLIARLAGKRFLEMRFERDATTYWERRERREDGDDRWEKQF